MVFRPRSAREGAGGGKGCLLGSRTREGRGKLQAKPTWAMALRKQQEPPPAWTLQPLSLCACVRTGTNEVQHPAHSKRARKVRLLSCGSAPRGRPGMGMGWANLPVGLGEPALSKGATQPRAQWGDARGQTPLPYLRPSPASLPPGKGHLLTDCNVFSFIFNDNQWQNPKKTPFLPPPADVKLWPGGDSLPAAWAGSGQGQSCRSRA